MKAITAIAGTSRGAPSQPSERAARSESAAGSDTKARARKGASGRM